MCGDLVSHFSLPSSRSGDDDDEVSEYGLSHLLIILQLLDDGQAVFITWIEGNERRSHRLTTTIHGSGDRRHPGTGDPGTGIDNRTGGR